MQILIGDLNQAVLHAGKVQKGIFPEADPDRELYKVTNSQGNFYAVTEGFTPLEVDDNLIPDDIDTQPYSYTAEEGFKRIYYPPSREELVDQQITEMQLALAEIYENMEG